MKHLVLMALVLTDLMLFSLLITPAHFGRGSVIENISKWITLDAHCISGSRGQLSNHIWLIIKDWRMVELPNCPTFQFLEEFFLQKTIWYVQLGFYPSTMESLPLLRLEPGHNIKYCGIHGLTFCGFLPPYTYPTPCPHGLPTHRSL